MPKITIHEQCLVETDTSNPFCAVLYYKFADRADIIVKRFMAYTGLPLEWESISVMSLTRFRDRCKIDMSPNSVSTTCAWLSAAISVYASDNGFNYRQLCETLSVKRDQGSFSFITESDMESIVDYYRHCDDIIKKAVAAHAIIEFYTGARKSDTEDLSISNIENKASYVERTTGEIRYIEVVSYTSKKTRIRATIPLKYVVREIFEDETIGDIVVSTCLFNTKIKEIVKEAGIDRMVHERRSGEETDSLLSDVVSSHTFRRSFATNLYRKGVNIDTISRMMGHTNSQQTRRYICGDTLVLDTESLAFFN